MELFHPLFTSLTVTLGLALVVLAAGFAMNYLLALESASQTPQGFAAHTDAPPPAQTHYPAVNHELTEDELIDAVKFTYRALAFFP